MEAEDSLPHPKGLATFPYPALHQFSLYPNSIS